MPRVLAALLGAYLLGTTLVDLGAHLAWHDQQRAGQLLLLAALPLFCLAGSAWDDGRGTLAIGPAGWALAAFAVLGAASAAASGLGRWSFLEWSLLLSLAGGAVLLAGARRAHGARMDGALLAVFAIATGALCARALLVHGMVFATGGKLDTMEIAGLGFSNRRFLGQFLTIAIPIAGAAAARARTPALRALAAVLLPGAWMLAFVSASRGTVFALVAAALCAALLLGRRVLPSVRQHAVAAGIGLAAYLLLFVVLPALASVPVALETRAGNVASSSGRTAIWAHVATLPLAHPWLGIGPMGLASEPYRGMPVAHPHNAVLQIAAEWGLPALLALGVAAILAGRTVRRHFMERPGERDALDTALPVAVAAWAWHSLVDGAMVMPVTQVAAMVAVGWCLGRLPAREPPRPAFAATRRAVAAGVLLLATGALSLAGPELARVMAGLPPVAESSGTDGVPRFWQRGWIPGRR